MSKKDNNETIKHEDLQIGNVYKVTLISGAVMMGVLFYKGENMIGETIVNQYGISFDKESYVYLCDTQIEKIEEAKVIDTDYFKEFENKHDIKCFNNDGELLSASRILCNVIYRDNNLEKLSKKERKELIKHLYFTNKDIIDVVEAFLVEKKGNKKAHDDKKKILDATLELLDNYGKIMNTSSYIDGAYNVIFKELGMEKFIKQIC